MKNHTDVLPARLIIGSLAVIGYTLCVGILILLYMDRKVDAALYTIAGGCISAIGALLANPSSRSGPTKDDEPVKVSTDPRDPLDVKDVTTPTPEEPTIELPKDLSNDNAG